MRPFDSQGNFRPTAEAEGIRRLAIRGAGVTVVSQGVGLGTQIIATVVLARLLTPSDFGVVAMVTTFSLLLLNFGLNGFSEAVLQREEMNAGLASNLFWINLTAGVSLALAFAAAGSLLARFYGDARVASVAAGVSVTIFMTSTSVLHRALLLRAMRFAAVSANDILARAVSVTVSIGFGCAGWGYWALVAGAIAFPLSTAAGAWILCPWVPSPPRRVAGTGEMVKFAIHTYGRFTVNYFTNNLDKLLVGWRFDALSLGFYKRAYDLFALSAYQLVGPLTSVAVSGLSRFQRDSVQYRRYVLRAIAVMAFIGMGVAADLMLIGKDLIRLLLGPGWEPAGRIFIFFAPGVGIMLVHGAHGWIHLSSGRADRFFRWGIVEFIVTGLLFITGLHWGPVGIAVAWSTSAWLLTLPSFWYAGIPIGFRVGRVIDAIWKYIAAALVAGCGSALLLSTSAMTVTNAGAGGALIRVVLTSATVAVLYLGIVTLLHRGLEPLKQFTALLAEMIPASKSSTAEMDLAVADGQTATTSTLSVSGASTP